MSDVTRINEHFEKLLEGGADRATSYLAGAVGRLAAESRVGTATAVIVASVDAVVAARRATAVVEMIDGVLASIASRESPTDRHVALTGRLLSIRAGVLRSMHRSAEALEDQDEALRLLAETASDAQLATLGHDRAVILADLGALGDAVGGLVEAREAFLAVRDRIGVAAADHNLAFVLHDLGALDDAVEYLNEARDIFLTTGMSEEAAACDQNLGVVLYDAGRLAEAGRRFAAARAGFDESGAPVGAAECDANLATVLEAMGRPQDAEHHRRRARLAGVATPDPRTGQDRAAEISPGSGSSSSGTASA